MLPTTTVTANGGKRSASQRSALPLYLRRIIRPKQMDFECGPACKLRLKSLLACALTASLCRRYTFWLMQQLCVSPKTACGPASPSWSTAPSRCVLANA